MRIGIDTAAISQHSGRGVGALGGHLLEALLREGEADEFILFAHARTPEARAARAGKPRVRVCERPPVSAGFSTAWLVDALWVDRQVRREHPDVFHAYFQWNLPIRRLPVPVVGHVYDLMPLAVSEIYTGRHGLPVGRKIGLYQRYLRRALRCVDRIIAISAHTRRDLVHLMGFPEERIDVVYPAPAKGMAPPPAEEVAVLRKRLGLPEGYLLYVGGYDYRKNVEVLLRAHARARRDGLDLPLALAGGMGSPYGQWIRRKVGTTGEESGVLSLGHVPDCDLPGLYAGARLFLYPSLYEGFGLPVLDAMACGTPVACSEAASLPEAAGGAALLLPPEDEEAWAGAMCRAAGDAALCAELSRKGLAHAARFSWGRAARETIAVYRSAAGMGGAP